MDMIETTQGVEVRIAYNWLDCPYRGCCPDGLRKKREASLIKRRGLEPRCSYNPSIFECKTYQKFMGASLLKIVYNLDCL